MDTFLCLVQLNAKYPFENNHHQIYQKGSSMKEKWHHKIDNQLTSIQKLFKIIKQKTTIIIKALFTLYPSKKKHGERENLPSYSPLSFQ